MMPPSPPLYRQIFEQLKMEIHAKWLQGLLPSESALQQRFSVSRSVIRQALSLLEAEGLIQRIQGKGSFVQLPSHMHRIVQSLNGLGMQLEDTGIPTQSDILQFIEVDYPQAPSEWGESKALKLIRLLKGADTPLAFIETYLPRYFLPFLSLESLSSQSLHHLLETQATLTLERSTRTICAIPATGDIAKHLALSIGSPVLLLEGRTFDHQNKTVEVFSTYHRGDKIKFDVETVI